MAWLPEDLKTPPNLPFKWTGKLSPFDTRGSQAAATPDKPASPITPFGSQPEAVGPEATAAAGSPWEEWTAPAPTAEPGEVESGTTPADNVAMNMEYENRAFPLVSGGGPQPVLQKKYLDYEKLGGKENVDQATKTQHENAAQAEERIGQAAAGANQQLAGVYKSEADRQAQVAADWRAQQLRHQELFQQRVAQIDQLSDKIARHRIDQDQFYSKPGNIISAIGAVILGFHSNPTLSHQVLNNAIERDIQNQKDNHQLAMADKLGLETNLGLYRQLMGDKQAGDMMYEAKMREVTANKIQEIGSQLRSQEAQQNALKQAAILRQQGAQLRMVAMGQIYHPAQFVQSEALRNANVNFGDTYVPPANNGQATGQPVTAGQAPAVQTEQPPGVATTSNPGVEGQPRGSGPLAPVPGQEDSIKKVDAWAEEVGSRTGDKKLAEMVKQRGYQRLARLSIVNGGNRAAMLKDMEAENKKELATAENIAKGLGPVVGDARRFGILRANTIALKNSFGGDSDKIDKYLSRGYRFVFGNDNILRINRAKDIGSAGDLTDKERHSVEVYLGQLQQAINQYIHDQSGVAVRPEEMQRTQRVISPDANFSVINTWINNESHVLGSKYWTAMSVAGPDAAARYMINNSLYLPHTPIVTRPHPKGQ